MMDPTKEGFTDDLTGLPPFHPVSSTKRRRTQRFSAFFYILNNLDSLLHLRHTCLYSSSWSAESVFFMLLHTNKHKRILDFDNKVAI